MQSSTSVDAIKNTVRPLRSASASTGLLHQMRWVIFTLTLVVNDLLLVGLAFRLAYYFRFEVPISIFNLTVVPDLQHYLFIILLILPIWLTIFAIVGLYNRHNLLGGTREYSNIFSATTMGMLFMISAGFLVPEFIIARAWLIMAWAFSFLFVSAGRFAIRRLVYYLREHGHFLSRAIIVGSNGEGWMLAEQLLNWKASGLDLIGFVENNTSSEAVIHLGMPILGSQSELDEILHKFKIEEMILTTSALTRQEMVSIFKEYGLASHVNLRLSSGLFEIITTGLQVQELSNVPLVRVNKVRLTGLDSVMKFILDYSLAIPVLILGAPIFLLVAIAIKLDSPGPIIYRRRVVGVNGQPFDAYKFRTMRIDGDEILAAHPDLRREWEENQKITNDPRVTRLGKYLRKASLDELPQLLNVLKREMSLVGPRMITPGEVARYKEWGHNLLTVRPGLTGLWQVSGRSDVSYEERVRLDMQYIRNWSIWLDLELILATIPAVLKGRGAY